MMRTVTLPERLTSRDKANILAGFASCDQRAATAFLEGRNVKPNLRERLVAAANDLGFIPATPVASGRAA